MKSYLELNVAINRLYRQLGKEVYQQAILAEKDAKKIDKIIKKINQKIEMIEKLQDHNSIEGILGEMTEKIILKPEKNDEGIPLYVFCKSCKVGNHPDSTHCIRCEEALK